MNEVGQILSEEGVPNAIKLDDLLVWGQSYSDCLKNVQRAIQLLSYFGFKINFRKSVLSPCQQTEYLGTILDSSNVCFSLTKAKRAKCMLFLSVLNKIHSFSVGLSYRFLGFFNFICELVPYLKSFLWIWHNQLKSCKSSRLKFSRIPVQAIWDLLTSLSFYIYPGLVVWSLSLLFVFQMPLPLEWPLFWTAVLFPSHYLCHYLY